MLIAYNDSLESNFNSQIICLYPKSQQFPFFTLTSSVNDLQKVMPDGW